MSQRDSVGSLSADSTTDDALVGVDLSGRHAVVTGATGGLGLETARALAAAGAAVTITGRTQERVRSAVDTLAALVPTATFTGTALELGDLASVEQAAAHLRTGPDIDLLINNAGVMMCPRSETVDGFETQFGVNHLGHFALTARLEPHLAADARVVAVSSAAHLRGSCDVDDLNWTTREYNKGLAYSHAKTANIWFASALQRRWAGTQRRAYSLHPGVIATDLSRHVTEEDRKAMSGRSLGPIQRKTIPQGAATSVWAATSPSLDAHGGAYLADCQIARPVDEVEDPRTGHAEWAYDQTAEEALWAQSASLTGLDV